MHDVESVLHVPTSSSACVQRPIDVGRKMQLDPTTTANLQGASIFARQTKVDLERDGHHCVSDGGGDGEMASLLSSAQSGNAPFHDALLTPNPTTTCTQAQQQSQTYCILRLGADAHKHGSSPD